MNIKKIVLICLLGLILTGCEDDPVLEETGNKAKGSYGRIGRFPVDSLEIKPDLILQNPEIY